MLKIKFYTFHTASYTVFVCKSSKNCTHTFDLEYRIKRSSVKTDFKTYSNFEDHDTVHVNNAPRENNSKIPVHESHRCSPLEAFNELVADVMITHDTIFMTKGYEEL